MEKYKTQPLECWKKAQELKGRMYMECWQAKEEGRLMGFSIANRSTVLTAGFPHVAMCETSSYTLTLSKDPELARQCSKAVEERGHFPDWCGHLRLLWGSMMLNRGPFGHFPKPDFILQMHYCEIIAKFDQLVAEYCGVPYFCIDLPLVPLERKREQHLQYLVTQFADAVEWLEKVTGVPCDDEKLIEGIRNEWESRILWCRILELQKNVPAPLDQRMIYTLSAPIFIMGHRKETLDFYKMAVDEVEYRVKNGIAALATERCRLLHDGLPVLYYLKLFRIPEQYGALFIIETYHFAQPSCYKSRPDGSWEIALPPWHRGEPLKTREDALRALAEWYLLNPAFTGFTVLPKAQEMVQIVRDWNIDGVVFHCNRGCQGLTAGQPEMRLELLRRNIPVLTYEANSADPAGFSESQIVDRLESFLEMLGLRRLSG